MSKIGRGESFNTFLLRPHKIFQQHGQYKRLENQIEKQRKFQRKNKVKQEQEPIINIHQIHSIHEFCFYSQMKRYNQHNMSMIIIHNTIFKGKKAKEKFNA